MGIVTTLGPRSQQELGLILPHEHIFVDLRTWDQPGYAEADAENVIRLIRPELDKARQAGVTAIVECTPVGVGRRVDLLKAVSLQWISLLWFRPAFTGSPGYHRGFTKQMKRN